MCSLAGECSSSCVGVKDGEVKTKFVGLQDQKFIENFIDKLES